VAPHPRIPLELRRRPFTLDQARAAGLSAESLRSKCWRRLGRGLYCWAKLEVEPWQFLAAWRNLLPPDFAFAGLSAAWLHRLDVDPCHPVEVVVPLDSWARSRASLVVRHGTFEVTTARGLPATTVERTFRDLRRRLPPMEILVLADEALRLRLGRFDELAELAESPMETRLRWSLLQAGLPKPEVQKDLRDAEGRFLGRADLYYPTARLVIEYDGANHRDRLSEDNRRQNRLLEAGFRLLRFTAADRPEVITAQVRRALV
jgi:very-short-patch-repair endonuclease